MCWFNANDYDDDCGDDDICRYTRWAQLLHRKSGHTSAYTIRTHWHLDSGYRFVFSLIWAHTHNRQPSLIIDWKWTDQNGWMIWPANRLSELGSFGNCYCGQQLAKSILFFPFQGIHKRNERKNEKCAATAAVVVADTLELERNRMKQDSIEKISNSKSVCMSAIATFQEFLSFGSKMCIPSAFSLPIVIVIIIVIINAHTNTHEIVWVVWMLFLLCFLCFFTFLRFHSVPTFCISIIINCLSNFQNEPLCSERDSEQAIAFTYKYNVQLYWLQRRIRKRAATSFCKTVFIILSVAFFSLFHSLFLSLQAVLTQTCCYCRSFFIHFDNKLAVLTWLYASIYLDFCHTICARSCSFVLLSTSHLFYVSSTHWMMRIQHAHIFT